MGQTRRPEIGAERLRQGHHGTTEHQSRQQPTHLGSRHSQEAIGDATAKIGHGGGGAIQNLQLIHPQLGVDAPVGQPLGRAGQQGMGSRPGAPQQAIHLQTPALLQSGAAGEAQGGGTLVFTLKLKHTPAGAGSRAQIGLEPAVQAHAQADIG